MNVQSEVFDSKKVIYKMFTVPSFYAFGSHI